MRDYDIDMERRGAWLSLGGFVTWLAGVTGFFFLVEADGAWSLSELAGIAMTIGGLIATIWGFVLRKRSGAVISRHHAPDGSRLPESGQWAAYTILTALAMGGLIIIGIMDGTGMPGSAVFWIGLALLPISAGLWVRAIRQERAAKR